MVRDFIVIAISLFFYFYDDSRLNWDSVFWGLLAVVFVITLCAIINSYPNGWIYSRFSNREVIWFMVESYLIWLGLKGLRKK